MKKKIIGITLLVGVIGVLAFGAINRTIAKSADFTSEASGGNGRGNGNNRASDIDFDSDHGYGNQVVEDHADLLDTLPMGMLDQVEIDSLQFMYEEEKLARDVYTVLYQVWGLPVFDNISRSEQTHMNSVLELLDRYGISPLASEQAGLFINPDLQELYSQLVVQGSKSIGDALMVGGAIEEIDILDLQQRMAQTDQEDILMVFENLERGSFNHLSAFASNYSRQTSSDYQPQYMSPEVFQKSIANIDGNGGGQGGRGRNGNNGGGN